MIRKGISTVVLVCACLPVVVPTAYALPNPLAEGLRRCASETDQAKRLSCFDSLAAGLPKVEADQFGLTADIAHKRDPVVERPAVEETLTGTIKAMHTAPRGELVFVLDNQQVWIQAEVNTRLQFAVGETVHIEHGAMGSLWLTVDKARKTKVKRIA
jgi:hypothetical protein